MDLFIVQICKPSSGQLFEVTDRIASDDQSTIRLVPRPTIAAPPAWSVQGAFEVTTAGLRYSLGWSRLWQGLIPQITLVA